MVMLQLTDKGAKIAPLFLAFALFTSRVSAGGLEFPDLGTVAIGRGTAFVARADNLSAFYYNPAGLSKGRGINVLLIGNVVHMNVDFLRAGTGEGVDIEGMEVQNPDQDYSNFDPGAGQGPVDFGKTSLQGNFGPSPMIVASWCEVGDVHGLALALGLFTPSSFGLIGYPLDGPQRYAMREAKFVIVYPGVGISYAFNRYIQIGGVFLSGIGTFQQSQAIRPLPQPNNTLDYNERAVDDAIMTVHAADYFMPSGIIGVLSNPLDWLEIGASVKIPVYVEAAGNIIYTAPKGSLSESELVEGRDKITLKQHFPWVVRAGARYVHEYFDIEADFVWENWSSMKGFDLDLDAELLDGIDPNPKEMPDATIPKNFRDTYSVRLGGDVEVWPRNIAVRLGGFYQTSAYPENLDTFSVDFPYGEQIGIGGGLTWHAAGFLDVNAGYLHIFQMDVEVEEGIVQQQGLPYESPDGEIFYIGNTINNGSYEVSMNLFGVSLEGHF
jgi:long-subunit fatty acid transport protein